MPSSTVSARFVPDPGSAVSVPGGTGTRRACGSATPNGGGAGTGGVTADGSGTARPATEASDGAHPAASKAPAAKPVRNCRLRITTRPV
ncbi:hypothetical protein GCM10023094_37200 [Rhodococcus olei]|uniref:Uncharacterized protein n=1 Tax=Rhodococcus olei TaxID=2161675 RepID=A0ABP8P9N8_9NOCA